MKPKFEKGDRVIYKPSNYVGTINGIDRDTDGYSILYDDGEEYYVHEDDLEFENPKLAFLTRLQELLATFDASIYDYESYRLCIDLVGGEQLEWSWSGKKYAESQLTAENVFDYDKDWHPRRRRTLAQDREDIRNLGVSPSRLHKE